jgi:hypothetical protein
MELKHVILPIMKNPCAEIFLSRIPGAQPMKFKLQDPNIVKFRRKYKFSRKWYIAEFDVKYYNEVDEWCTKQFGKHDKCPDAWSRWWHRYEYSIHFRDEKDYILFVLKWHD